MSVLQSGLRALFAASVACALPGPVAWAAPEIAAEAAHLHLAARGDTLIGLGRRFLADPSTWPEIARASGLVNPHRVPLGSRLRIPLRLMRVERMPATVTAVSGDVRSVDGQGVRAGQSLDEGAALRTGADGGATVRLVDGTLLRLRASSQLGIEQSNRLRDVGVVRSGVKLQSGRVEVEVEPVRGGHPGFRIGTPQGVLGVRGTEFRVLADAARSVTRSEVLRGAVAAQGLDGAAEQRVEAGFGVVVDATGRVAPPTRLLPPPDLSTVPTLQERPLVRLSVAPLAGAAGFRAQVAGDASFDRVLQEVDTSAAEIRIAGLPDGHYVVRVRGVDAAGLEGRDAELRFRLKARPEPPLPSAPASRAVLFGGRVEFAWAAHDEAVGYRFQLANDSGFSVPLRDLPDLRTPSLALEGLVPGRYQWRLASVRAGADQGPFGAVQGFELRPLPPTPAPPQVGDVSVRFAWEGAPGQTFDFQLARDTSFVPLIVDRRLDAPGIKLPLPGSGRFYMRIRTRDADGFVGPFTAPQSFEVPFCLRDSAGACWRADGRPLLLVP
jgi:hypothetical protein